MLRKTLTLAALIGALALPVSARANHGGCLASSAAPVCTYTAIGAHQAAGYTASTWEAWVMRTVDGVSQKVVLASGTGEIAGDDVPADAGEKVTLVINNDGPNGSPVGVVSAGNTSGHP